MNMEEEISAPAGIGLRIAFGYEARVGKDASADFLIQEYGGTRLSFARVLYDIQTYAQRACGFPEVKDRTFLQWLGTEWGRKQDPNVWVKIVERQIEAASPTANLYVIDVRFPNEMEMLRRHGFLLVNLTRNQGDRMATFGNGSTAHASETALSGPDVKWDKVIENNGSLKDLHLKLFKMVEVEQIVKMVLQME